MTCETGNERCVQGQQGKTSYLLCTRLFFLVLLIDFFYFIFPINSLLLMLFVFI